MKRRTSGWSFRLVREGNISESAYFITLTYDTRSVPITRNGFMSLCKKDLQNFFKRLRKISNSDLKIKYYAVGEYGGKTERPHYHLILFNADILKVEEAWSLGKKPIGGLFVGDVKEESIGYVLKYMCKEKKVGIHKNDDRQPEFSLMSKGLGKNYLTPQMVQWHKNDIENRMYVNIKDGKKASMPRYYKDKIYSDEEKQRISKHMEELQIVKDAETIAKLGEYAEKILVERHQNMFRIMNKTSQAGRDKI